MHPCIHRPNVRSSTPPRVRSPPRRRSSDRPRRFAISRRSSRRNRDEIATKSRSRESRKSRPSRVVACVRAHMPVRGRTLWGRAKRTGVGLNPGREGRRMSDHHTTRPAPLWIATAMGGVVVGVVVGGVVVGGTPRRLERRLCPGRVACSLARSRTHARTHTPVRSRSCAASE